MKIPTCDKFVPTSIKFVTLVVLLNVLVGTVSSSDPEEESDPILEKKYTEIYGQLNTEYTNFTSKDNLFQYVFTVDKSLIRKRATTQLRAEVRVQENASVHRPILFTIMHQRFSAEMWLPFEFGRTSVLRIVNPDIYYYSARSLCINANETHGNMSVTIQVMTRSIRPVNFTVSLRLSEDLQLSLGRKVYFDLAPTTPKYLRFSFKDSNYVTINAASNLATGSSNCITMSIQPDECPIYDLQNNVRYKGLWQTMSKSGAMSMRKSERFPEGFALVFVAHTNDAACNETDILAKFGNIPTNQSALENINEEYQLSNFKDPQTKIVSVVITNENDITWQKFFLCLIIPLIVTLVVFMLVVIPLIWRHERMRKRLLQLQDSSIESGENLLLDIVGTMTQKKWWQAELSVAIFKCKEHKLKEISKKYWWTTLIVAIFYGAPAYQLVLYYLKVLHKTGDLDMCYYNYRCAQRFGSIIDFNHVWSNASYIIFGILFILICKFSKGPNAKTGYGIPSHYGVFYALGFALAMEGVLSAAYHLCPNQSTFQFDTCFMNVIAVLILVKIHQFRHPVHYGPNTTFVILALLLSISVLGLVFEGGIIAKLIVALFVFLQFAFLIVVIYPYIYAIGYIKDGTTEAIGLLHVTNEDGESVVNGDDGNSLSDGENLIEHNFSTNLGKGEEIASKPLTGWGVYRRIGQITVQELHKDRLILPVASLCISFLVTVYSLTFEVGYATHILYVLVGNSLASTVYYLIMKLLHGEFKKFTWVIPSIYFLASAILGGFSLSYFLRTSSHWELPASHSRDLNEDCLPKWFSFHPFYDTHDAWHFLSAASLFLAFMGLLTVDDDLITTPQTEIKVF